jgi:hypothetical protein
MGTEENITLDMVRQHFHEEGGFHLWDDFSGIEPDAAAYIVDNATSAIFLSIRQLCSESAAILSTHSMTLHFETLSELTDGAAAALAKHQARLVLAGVQRLSPAAASALEKTSAHLVFPNLKRLDFEVTAALEYCKAKSLEFHGLQYLAPESAAHLASTGGRLTVFTHYLPLAAAEVLSGSRSSCLTVKAEDFHGTTAEALSSFASTLVLYCPDGVPFEADVAHALKNHRGTLFFNSPIWDRKVCKGLSEHSGGGVVAEVEIGLFGGFDPFRLTLGGARELSKSNCDLSLRDPRTLPEKICEALSRHRGTLQLPRLKRLSAAGAQWLRRHPGPLRFTKELESASLALLDGHPDVRVD